MSWLRQIPFLQWASIRCNEVKGNWQLHKSHHVGPMGYSNLFFSPFFLQWISALCVKPPLLTVPAIPPESLVLVIVCLSSACWCAVCIFNHNSNPLTFLQSNFQAPKPTLTLRRTRTRTGLSINLPKSWMPPALKSSGLLEQVSPSLCLSALAV